MVKNKIQKEKSVLLDRLSSLYFKSIKKGILNEKSAEAMLKVFNKAQNKTLKRKLAAFESLYSDGKRISVAAINRYKPEEYDEDDERGLPVIKNTLGNIFKKYDEDDERGVPVIKNTLGNIFSLKNKQKILDAFVIKQTSRIYRNRSLTINVWMVDNDGLRGKKTNKIGNVIFKNVKTFHTINLNREIIDFFGANTILRKTGAYDKYAAFMDILDKYEPEVADIIRRILYGEDGYIILENVIINKQTNQGYVAKKLKLTKERGNKNMFQYIGYKALPLEGNLENLFVKELNSYVHDNYQSDSCMLTEIINIYKPSFDKLNKIKQLKFQLTYESLYELIFPNSPYVKGVQHEASLEDIEPFFKKFHLKCYAFNVKYQIIYKYIPESNINEYIYPSTAYMLVHDKHVEISNKNLKSLDHIIGKFKNEGEEKELIVKDKYQFMTDEDNKIYTFCLTQEHFTQELTTMKLEEEKDRKIYIDYAGDFQKLLTYFIVKLQYNPKIKMVNQCFESFSFMVNDNYITIRQAGFNPDNMNIIFTQEEQYKLYDKYYKQLYKFIINKTTKSRYHPDFIDTVKNNKVYPPTGKWTNSMMKEATGGSFIGYDIQKAFTHALMQIKFFPVFNEFDTWKKYNGHSVNDYTFYYVEHKLSNIKDPDFIILPKKYSVIPGYVINRRKLEINIMYFTEPYKLVKNEAPKIIEEMYKSKLDLSHKKNLVNILIGMLGKQKNRITQTLYFEDKDEAYHLKDKSLSQVHAFQLEDQTLYATIAKNESELIEGFMPLSVMIHSLACMRMAELYEQIVKAGGTPLSIRTDCIVVDKPCLKLKPIKVNNSEDFQGGKEHSIKFYNIGQVRIEESKSVSGNTFKFWENPQHINVQQLNIKHLKVQDEWNKEETSKVVANNNLTRVLADVPGAGKTTLFKNWFKSGINGLFVTPYNNLACELIKEGFIAITLNKLIGLLMNEKMSEEKGKAYDITDIEVVVFDEVYCHTTENLARIKTYMKENKEIKFYATGDSNQLPPIENLNKKDKISYYDEIMTSLFPNVLTLHDSKRLKTKEDQERLNEIKYDIFSGEMSMVNVAKKYFKIVHKLEDIQGFGIAYRNKTVNGVNDYCHTHKNKDKPVIKVNINGILLYRGLDLVCKKYIRLNKSQKMNINYTYTITKVSKDFITLTDHTKELFEIPIKLMYCFTLNYCRTGHSVQGVTVQDNITVFDISDFMMSPRWFYTAISRVVDLNNVFIYIDKENELDYQIEETQFKANCIWKINGHKKADEKKGFDWEDKDYVNIEWIKEQMIKSDCTCYRCQTNLEYLKVEKQDNQFSVNRLNNDLPHVMTNCEIICFKCNRELK